MITSNQTILIDANIIIHLEKAMLLPILVDDKDVMIVDLIYYEEYEFKSDNSIENIKNIKKIGLSDTQIFEASNLSMIHKKNSFFDYCNYILARDNNYIFLTGDKPLKNKIKNEIKVYGIIWYIKRLFYEGKINFLQVENAVKIWIEDPLVYIPEDLLIEMLNDLK